MTVSFKDAANDNAALPDIERERALAAMRQAMRALRRCGLDTARAMKGMR